MKYAARARQPSKASTEPTPRTWPGCDEIDVTVPQHRVIPVDPGRAGAALDVDQHDEVVSVPMITRQRIAVRMVEPYDSERQGPGPLVVAVDGSAVGSYRA